MLLLLLCQSQSLSTNCQFCKLSVYSQQVTLCFLKHLSYVILCPDLPIYVVCNLILKDTGRPRNGAMSYVCM